MITVPAQWVEERNRLHVLRSAQSRREYEWQLDEQPVTEGDFAVLDATPITAEDLSILVSEPEVRGTYRAGDTQGFVIQHEQTCVQYNCWMIRTDDGSTGLISEPPQPALAKL